MTVPGGFRQGQTIRWTGAAMISVVTVMLSVIGAMVFPELVDDGIAPGEPRRGGMFPAWVAYLFLSPLLILVLGGVLTVADALLKGVARLRWHVLAFGIAAVFTLLPAVRFTAGSAGLATGLVALWPGLACAALRWWLRPREPGPAGRARPDKASR